jgi:hypothetical protein
VSPDTFPPEVVFSIFLLGILAGFVVASLPLLYIVARVAFQQPPPSDPSRHAAQGEPARGPSDCLHETPDSASEMRIRQVLAQERELARLDELDRGLQPFGLRMLRGGRQ